MFGEEELPSVRSADRYNYDTLVGGATDSTSFDERASCCEIICGRPQVDEPKLNLLCCSLSKRVVKNMVMFVIVILVYMFFLSLMMGG